MILVIAVLWPPKERKGKTYHTAHEHLDGPCVLQVHLALASRELAEAQ